MPQPGEGSPGALLGQQGAKQVERMDRRQQMHPPELRGAQSPTWAAHGADTPALVDKTVGNVWIQEFEQLVTAGHRKAVHARTAYPFELVASDLCSKPHFFDRLNCDPASYAKTCNTF
jgi:hypothetical protein